MPQPSPKPVIWLGDTLSVLRTCPQDVQDEVGYALYLAQIGEKYGDAKPLLVKGTLCVVRRASRLELEALRDALTQSMKPAKRGQQSASYAEAQYKLGVAAWVYPEDKEERKRILTEQGAFATRACDIAEALAEEGIEELDEGN